MQSMLKRKKITCDFSKFSFKLDKADADILKNHTRTDFENDLLTAS